MSEFEIPIAFSNVQSVAFANYAGFEVPDEAEDAQVKHFGEVTITNISKDNRVILDISLVIEGNGIKLTQNADLLGPFGLKYGRDDRGTKMLIKHGKEIPIYFENPIEIEPQHHKRARLVFLFSMGAENRNKITDIMMYEQNYKFTIIVHDHISGLTNFFTIPGFMRAASHT